MRRNPKEISKMKSRLKFWQARQIKDLANGQPILDVQLTANRFRKVHPQDCGNTLCGLCSRHKRFGEPSVKDLIADDRARDQIDEALQG